MTPVIRPARAEDVPELMAIAADSPTMARWNEQAYRKLFEPGGSSHLVALVIEEGGVVNGFAAGRWVDTEAELENLAVRQSARNRGLGALLLRQFLDKVRSLGAQDVYLDVRESNRTARRLYERFGFVETGRRRGYYRAPDEDALLLKFSF